MKAGRHHEFGRRVRDPFLLGVWVVVSFGENLAYGPCAFPTPALRAVAGARRAKVRFAHQALIANGSRLTQGFGGVGVWLKKLARYQTFADLG